MTNSNLNDEGFDVHKDSDDGSNTNETNALLSPHSVSTDDENEGLLPRNHVVIPMMVDDTDEFLSHSHSAPELQIHKVDSFVEAEALLPLNRFTPYLPIQDAESSGYLDKRSTNHNNNSYNFPLTAGKNQQRPPQIHTPPFTADVHIEMEGLLPGNHRPTALHVTDDRVPLHSLGHPDVTSVPQQSQSTQPTHSSMNLSTPKLSAPNNKSQITFPSIPNTPSRRKRRLPTMTQESYFPSLLSLLQVHLLRGLLVVSILVNLWLLRDTDLNVFSTARQSHGSTTGASLHAKPFASLPLERNGKLVYFPTSNYQICRQLSSPSAMFLWTSNLEQILSSSYALGSPHDQYILFQLLRLISPRLHLSLSNFPRHDYHTIGQILNKGWSRYKHLTRKEKQRMERQTPPPLKIVVMGGSIPFGQGCKNQHEATGSSQLSCSWPNQLQAFLNQFFGFPIDKDVLVEVINIASPDMTSDIGTAILEYNILQSQIEDADILINAYSSNDNVHGEAKVFEMIQAFYRQVRAKPHPCQNRESKTKRMNNEGSTGRNRDSVASFSALPLYIHLDDTIGSEKSLVTDSSKVMQAVRALSNYYGFSAVSYANVVREFVYEDPNETWFSSSSLLEEKNDEESTPEILHVAIAWIVSYNLLHLITTHCSVEGWSRMDETNSHEDRSSNHASITITDSVPPPELFYMRNPHDTILQGMPNLPKTSEEIVLLPNIDSHLKIFQVTKHFKDEAGVEREDNITPSSTVPSEFLEDCPASENHSKAAKPFHQCPFSWLTGHDGTEANGFEPSIFSHIVESSAWLFEPETERNRGFKPPVDGVNATMTFEFPQVAQPIRTVLLFYMKGTGVAWQSSQVNVQVRAITTKRRTMTHNTRNVREAENNTYNTSSIGQRSPYKMDSNSVHNANDTEEMIQKQRKLEMATAVVANVDISGASSREMSEIAVERIHLVSQISEGQTLQIQITFLEGNAFKITGVAVCS